MRSQVLPAVLLSVLILTLTAPLSAQVRDTAGVVDTLAFAPAQAAPGEHVAVAVLLTNDYPCIALTVPVGYPPDLLHADSVSFAGGRVAHFPLRTAALDTSAGNVVLSAVQFGGTPLLPGAGAVAWIHFRVVDTVTPGRVAVLDTVYVNDPGRLLLVGGASGNYSYQPYVAAGQFTVESRNHAPYFLFGGARAVREGDSIRFQVQASDADGDQVDITPVAPGPGMEFLASGPSSGEFRWKAPYTGPYSASGGLQQLRFVADDGKLATTLEIPLTVVNVNRPPVIHAPDTITSPAFDSVFWQATASDPDLDFVTISLGGLPSAAQVAPGNPAQVAWRPMQADTGTYPIVLVADDGQGAKTRLTSFLRIAPGMRVTYSLDTISGHTDEDVVLSVFMKNQETISGVELLVNIDPTAATILGVERIGTRTEGWEMFAVSQNYAGRPGDLYILGRADINDGFPTPKLAPGEGTLLKIRLHLASDELFAGLAFPVRFVFRTAMANTAIDASGDAILQNEIAYRHGEVQILQVEDRLTGDINLNGLAFEVGDVVYFANYFSSPSLYPLNFEQRANSDVNGDGTPATIADLVFMISVIAGSGSPKASAGDEVCYVGQDASGNLTLASHSPVAGVHVVLELANGEVPTLGPALSGLTVKSGQEGRIWRCVAYSESGQTAHLEQGPVLQGLAGARVISVGVASASGTQMRVVEESHRPREAELLGNYPNPFNPETSIKFALGEPGVVTIEVYNLLGLRVRVLEGSFPAGPGELVWDGRDTSGRPVASGVYFYKLVSEGTHQVRRMLLLK